MDRTAARESARLRAMQAIGEIDNQGNLNKMDERAIKGYIELLETRITAMENALDWIKQNTTSDAIFTAATDALKSP